MIKKEEDDNSIDAQIRRLQTERHQPSSSTHLGFNVKKSVYDDDLYGDNDKSKFSTVVVDDELEDEEILTAKKDYGKSSTSYKNSVKKFNDPRKFFEELVTSESENKRKPPVEDTLFAKRSSRIIDNEDEYRAKWRTRKLSPPRADPFAAMTQPSVQQQKKRRRFSDEREKEKNKNDERSYREIMQENLIENERKELIQKIQIKKKEEVQKVITDEERKRLAVEMVKREQEKRQRQQSRPSSSSSSSSTTSSSSPSSSSSEEASVPQSSSSLPASFSLPTSSGVTIAPRSSSRWDMKKK